MVLADGDGLPLGVTIASASPHEVKLIEPLLERRLLRRRIRRLIYDQAADSDPLRARLNRRGIELICPHRRNRTKPPTQDRILVTVRNAGLRRIALSRRLRGALCEAGSSCSFWCSPWR